MMVSKPPKNTSLYNALLPQHRGGGMGSGGGGGCLVIAAVILGSVGLLGSVLYQVITGGAA